MSKTIKSVLIDDEKNSLIILSKLLEKNCPEVEIIGTAQSVAEGVEVINNLKPELLFLDINMPDGDGFEVLEQIEDTALEVIFTTAYNKYAIRAFEFAALHYLLKPIEKRELKEAVGRYKEIQEEDLTEKIKVLNNNLNKKADRLVLPTQSGLNIIELKNVIRCESSNNYTTFFMNNNKKIVVSKSIKTYEELLAGNNFCRIHNQHLINLNYLKKYVRGRGGYVIMTNDSHVDVSEGKKKQFLKELGEFTVG